MKVRVSQHAKLRANQRLNLSYKAERNKQFNKALKNGISYKSFGGDFYNYLLKKKNKNKNTGIKVYNNNIYVYKGKLIITVYPVPEKYIPVESYLSSFLNNGLLIKLYSIVDKSKIKFDVILKEKNNVTCSLYIEDNFMNFGSGTNETTAINNAVEVYLNKYVEEMRIHE